MKILIDINHPADVHQFKYVIKKLAKKHEILVIARNKDCVHQLLHENNINFLPRLGFSSFFTKIIGFPIIDLQIYMIASKFKPDVLVGSSGDLYITHVGKLIGKPSFIFDDTEHSKIQNFLCFPFATAVYTPISYKLDLGKKQRRYEGFKELAYLNYKYFKPNKKTLKDLNLKKGQKLILLRLVSWQASHDLGKKSIIDYEDLTKRLGKYGKVIISSEKKLPSNWEKYIIPKHLINKIHDIVFYSDLVISEGATIAVESAVLGTPTIYVNKLCMGYSDLMIKSKRMFQITNYEKLVNKSINLLSKNTRKRVYNIKFDFNQYAVDEIEKWMK